MGRRVHISTRLSVSILLVSLALHVLGGILLVLLSVPPVPGLPVEDSIAVTLEPAPAPVIQANPASQILSAPLTASPAVLPQASPAMLPVAVPDPAEQPLAPPPDPRPTVPTLMPATHLFSERILADPRSRKVRAALRTLSVEEQITQLCNMEAMEQVHQWQKTLQPDNLVAYAFADTQIAGNAVDAEGGAFRSARRWYGIRYRCTVDADRSKVASFAFLIGDEIPEAEWPSHNLTTDDGPAE